MKFKEYIDLNELFDKPYSYEEIDPAREYKVVLDTPSGKKDVYEITFELRVFEVDGNEILGLEINFFKNGSQTINKSSSREVPFRIFATIIEILRKEISLSKIDFIMFNGSKKEPSRIKLYKSMVKYMKKQLKWEDIIIKDEGPEISFIISKRKFRGL